MRIKCAECADFDLCLECFSVGVEAYPHRSNHAYRVIDNLSFPLYQLDWGVRAHSEAAELILLPSRAVHLLYDSTTVRNLHSSYHRRGYTGVFTFLRRCHHIGLMAALGKLLLKRYSFSARSPG